MGRRGVEDRSGFFRTIAKYSFDKQASDEAHWPRYGKAAALGLADPENVLNRLRNSCILLGIVETRRGELMDC
jgi:hypothetical protein